MSEFAKFFDNVLENRISSIHTLMPCRIESYNYADGIADVTPLYKLDGQQLPLLFGLPVLKQKYKFPDETIETKIPYYEIGDIVTVAFFERAYDAVANGQIADPVYTRKHALEDGIVIGLI